MSGLLSYDSHTLTKAEANYSVIQRECLAILWAMKQSHHYLLGCTIQLMADHTPLQWLGEQKIEGLCSTQRKLEMTLSSDLGTELRERG